MAQNKNGVTKASPKKLSATEVQKIYEENKNKFKELMNSASTKEALKQLRDVTKNVQQTTLSSYSKDKIITFLKDISKHENDLRNLSRYLFYRSQIYFRLVMYNATMFDLDARYVVPDYELTGKNNKKKMLDSYCKTLKMLDTMDLQRHMLPVFINNFIEDAFFGCCWIDETGMFILQIPAEYCKISGQYYTSDYSFSVDMSKYKKYEDIIQHLGEPFTSMYKAYGGNNSQKWQPMPDEYALCTKARSESWETVCPIYSGLFLDLINLLDLADIQAVADAQQIYKLIVAKMPLLSGSSNADDWAVDPSTALEYYKKLEESLPDYVGSAITPIPLDTITFDNDQATDTTKIQNATKSVLNTSGGAQVLNSGTISGAEAFRIATRSDSELAISALLGQVQGFVNRMLGYQLSNPSKVKFFKVSKYTKDAFKESMQKDLNYGIVSSLALNSLNGFSELDTLALNFLERDVLSLRDRFEPLKTASTTSNTDNEGGGQEKDGDLTDEGEKSKDRR